MDNTEEDIKEVKVQTEDEVQIRRGRGRPKKEKVDIRTEPKKRGPKTDASKHEDYLDVLEKEKIIKKEVVSIRCFNHQLFTYVENKTALTPYYDKMQLIDKNTCVPFGYLGS